MDFFPRNIQGSNIFYKGNLNMAFCLLLHLIRHLKALKIQLCILAERLHYFGHLLFASLPKSSFHLKMWHQTGPCSIYPFVRILRKVGNPGACHCLSHERLSLVHTNLTSYANHEYYLCEMYMFVVGYGPKVLSLETCFLALDQWGNDLG